MRKVDEEKIVSVIASAGSAKSFAFQAMEEAEAEVLKRMKKENTR